MINRRHVLAIGAAAAALPAMARAPDDAGFDAALTTAFETVRPVALAGAVVTGDGLIWSGVRGSGAKAGTIQRRRTTAGTWAPTPRR